MKTFKYKYIVLMALAYFFSLFGFSQNSAATNTTNLTFTSQFPIISFGNISMENNFCPNGTYYNASEESCLLCSSDCFIYNRQNCTVGSRYSCGECLDGCEESTTKQKYCYKVIENNSTDFLMSVIITIAVIGIIICVIIAIVVLIIIRRRCGPPSPSSPPSPPSSPSPPNLQCYCESEISPVTNHVNFHERVVPGGYTVQVEDNAGSGENGVQVDDYDNSNYNDHNEYGAW